MAIYATSGSMFKEFFLDNKVGIAFELFSLTHILLVIGTILIIFLLHKNRDYLFKINDKVKRNISLILIFIMFMNMTIYYLTKAYYGAYDWQTNLPLHFCFISGYLFMYSILFNKHSLYKLVYFFAFVGPIPAIIFPDLTSSFDAFLFYQQVLSHHFFLIASMYIFYAYDIKIVKKDLYKAFGGATLIYVLVGIFNFIFKTNYIMQNKLPDHILRLFPFLKAIDNPVWLLFICGTLILFLALIPIKYKDNKSVYIGD